MDKEDIVVSNTSETSPPALPPVAQTLPSQPLDVVFIERRGENCWFTEIKVDEKKKKELFQVMHGMDGKDTILFTK